VGLFAVVLRDRAHRLPQDHLAGLAPGLSSSDGPVFRARADTSAPSGAGDVQVRGPTGGGAEDAPRGGAHDQLVWEATALDGTPVSLIAGDRLRIELAGAATDDFELTRAPTPHRLLAGAIIFTGEALRVSLLYPHTALLRELGGAPVAGAGAIPVGFWRTGQSPQEGGEQYTYGAEAAYQWLPYLDTTAHPNREIVVNGEAYRITEVLPHEAAPRVALSLRRVRAGG
jgi:hypothetical protein